MVRDGRDLNHAPADGALGANVPGPRRATARTVLFHAGSTAVGARSTVESAGASRRVESPTSSLDDEPFVAGSGAQAPVGPLLSAPFEHFVHVAMWCAGSAPKRKLDAGDIALGEAAARKRLHRGGSHAAQLEAHPAFATSPAAAVAAARAMEAHPAFATLHHAAAASDMDLSQHDLEPGRRPPQARPSAAGGGAAMAASGGGGDHHDALYYRSLTSRDWW